MIYTYRVSLSGIKGFFRIYKTDSDTSLYAFHKQLRDDLEFAPDQPILFKGLGEAGEVLARYALIDMGFGSVDHVTVADTVKAGVKSFVYFYDVLNKKSVNITLEAEEKGSLEYISLEESKGPNPIEFENGYVAFEDLPDEKRHLPGEHASGEEDSLDDEDFDDGDEDDDEQDSDKEEEELIYDGED